MISNVDKALCRVWAEVDLGAIQENYLLARHDVPKGTKIAAVVKANAYGHGVVAVVKTLQSLPEGQRPDFYAVATAGEAYEIKELIGNTPIVVLGHVLPAEYERVIREEIRIPVDTKNDIEEITAAAKRVGKKAFLHVALDTGMTRIGFEPSRESAMLVAEAAGRKELVVEGLFSHYATADMADVSSSKKQTAQFESFVAMLKEQGVTIPLCHMSNSAGISRAFPYYSMVRLGVCLYGLRPSFEVPATGLRARAAMSFCSRIVRVREVPAGTPVSYGGTFVTEKTTRIATVSAGYADGLLRSQRGGSVLINGKESAILGTICMDQMMVDVTDIPEAEVGMPVTIFGFDGERFLDTDLVAKKAGTIGYELICAVSERVPRIYKKPEILG